MTSILCWLHVRHISETPHKVHQVRSRAIMPRKLQMISFSCFRDDRFKRRLRIKSRNQPDDMSVACDFTLNLENPKIFAFILTCKLTRLLAFQNYPKSQTKQPKKGKEIISWQNQIEKKLVKSKTRL